MTSIDLKVCRHVKVYFTHGTVLSEYHFPFNLVIYTKVSKYDGNGKPWDLLGNSFN